MSTPREIEGFDAYASTYDAALARGISVSGEDKAYFAEGRVAWLARCLREQSSQPRHILDFGCGTGSAVPFFFEHLRVQSVVGVDVSAQSLQIAERTHGSPAVRFVRYEDHQPAGDIDLVFCNGVFHHIPLDKRVAAARFIWQSLRPGGLFALWENNAWHPGARYVMWRIPFDRDAIPLSPPVARQLLTDAGFIVQHTTYQFVFPRLLNWFRRFEPGLARWPFGAQYQVLAQRP